MATVTVTANNADHEAHVRRLNELGALAEEPTIVAPGESVTLEVGVNETLQVVEHPQDAG